MTRALTLIEEDKNAASLVSLRELFESEIFSAFPDVEINGEGPRVSNTSNLFFPGVDGESLLIALDMHKIAASHASACASGALKPSRVLLKMGYSRERASSSLRFSFSRFNTAEEVKRAAQVLISLVLKIRDAVLS